MCHRTRDLWPALLEWPAHSVLDADCDPMGPPIPILNLVPGHEIGTGDHGDQGAERSVWPGATQGGGRRQGGRRQPRGGYSQRTGLRLRPARRNLHRAPVLVLPKGRAGREREEPRRRPHLTQHLTHHLVNTVLMLYMF